MLQRKLKDVCRKNSNQAVGYLIFNPQLKRINQIAVATFRDQGIGQILIQHINSFYSEEIINIVEQDKKCIDFFRKLA